ncbi:hypothetical protein niasHT_014864 [Heterodera trifolii]|uniref:Uncharacterized protein n=1 Tax=Heterodera trifolii TaxID=157864 RepID=A0ABD2L6T2_9BILA
MSTSPSAAVFIFAYSFFSVELITCVAVMVIACMNLAVIVPTKLLHLNLKSILITQTVAIMIYVLQLFAMLLRKFTSDDLFAPANVVLQVAENLKTAKQLSPAFLCLFLSNLSMNISLFVVALNLVTENYQISLVIALSVWIDTIFGAAIEFTVLTHHPLLKRRFIILMKRIFCFKQSNRIEEVPQKGVQVAKEGSIKQQNETTEHFKIIRQAWT